MIAFRRLLLVAAVCAPALTTACATAARPSNSPIAQRPVNESGAPAVADAQPSEDDPPRRARVSEPRGRLTGRPAIECSATVAGVSCRDTASVTGDGAAARLRPLDSASMSDDELRVAGPDASDWIALARAVAGIGSGAERIYVDGMPAIAPVPASAIGRVTVNGDPFTAEHSNVGETRIDIDPRVPDRRWRASVSSPSLGFGGGSPLAAGGTAVSRHSSFALGGPVPRLPITFSANASYRFDARQPLFVDPYAGMLAAGPADLRTSSTHSTLMVTLAYDSARIMGRMTLSGSAMRADHAGIGGTNGPTTGQRIDSVARGLQTTWRMADAERIHRGGFSFSHDALRALADSSAPLTVVTGQHAKGGDELASTARASAAWTFKHVVDGRHAKWKAGLEGGSQRIDDHRTPNPHGRLQLAAMDARSGTWIVNTQPSAAAARTTSAAVFAEQLMWQTPSRTLRSGIRVDWQDRAGILVSPRIVAAASLRGIQLSGGAGLFVKAWTPDLFVTAAARQSAATFVVREVEEGPADRANLPGGERLRLLIPAEFERRRDVIFRGGVQRTTTRAQAGIEHTWTYGASLAGTVRERDASGLIDVVQSDRRMRRHQTYARMSLRQPGGTIAASYQRAWSFDDSEGPLALPARRADVTGEWARSTGVARHAGGLTANLRLPWQMRMSVVAEARSGLPYTILTGRDADGLATFTDRGGLPRNAGELPAFRKLSLSASRLVRVPRVSWLAFDVGLRADNVTNQRNITSVGHVIGSPMFGLPLNAAPGRSIRVWAALAR